MSDRKADRYREHCLKCRAQLDANIEFCPVCGHKRAERLQGTKAWTLWDTVGAAIAIVLVIASIVCSFAIPDFGSQIAFVCGCIVFLVGYSLAILETTDVGTGRAIGCVLVPPLLILEMVMEHRRYSWSLSLIGVGCLLCTLPLLASVNSRPLNLRSLYLIEDQEDGTLVFFGKYPQDAGSEGWDVEEVQLIPPEGLQTLVELDRWLKAFGTSSACLGQSRDNATQFRLFEDIFSCQKAKYRVLGHEFEVNMSGKRQPLEAPSSDEAKPIES